MNNDSFEFGVSPFYFLRHGETYQSEAGILQGQDETELSREGRRTAERAAETLSSITLGSIYASPLKRTMLTASIVSVFTGIPIQTLPGLMERNWGAYQGLPKRLRPSIDNPPTAESMAAFRERVLTAMHSISGPSPVLVVAHSGVFRILSGYAGIAMDHGVSVASSQVLKLVPTTVPGQAWRISVV